MVMQSRPVELGPTGPQLVSVPGSVFLRGATVSGYHDPVVRKILRYPEARLKEESWPVTATGAHIWPAMANAETNGETENARNVGQLALDQKRGQARKS